MSRECKLLAYNRGIFITPQIVTQSVPCFQVTDLYTTFSFILTSLKSDFTLVTNSCTWVGGTHVTLNLYHSKSSIYYTIQFITVCKYGAVEVHYIINKMKVPGTRMQLV